MKESHPYGESKHAVFNSMLQTAQYQTKSKFDTLKTRRKFLTKRIYNKLDTVALIIYTSFLQHNFCQTNTACALDEDKEKAHMERHKLEEVNKTKRLDSIFSLNTC